MSSEHVEVLRHMKETIKAIMPSEVAALDAAIAALSAPQPPAEAQAAAKLVVEKDGLVKFIRPTGLGLDLPAGEYLLHLHPSPAEAQPVAWEWEYIGGDHYPQGHKVARSLREMDPTNPPHPETWRPTRPLIYGDTAPPSVPEGVEDHGVESPGEDPKPPHTPAMRWLADREAVATQEWQDGFNDAYSYYAQQHVGVEDVPIDASDNAEYIEHCADRLERCGLRVTAGALRVIAHEHRTLAQQPAAVGGAAVERVAALLHNEATDEPWTVAGVEHDGPDREYYRELARKAVAHATAAKDAEIEALRAINDNREAIIATHAADTREYQKQIMHAEARAERMAEALREACGQVRELCDAHIHQYPEASFARYEAALSDHGQEGKDG